MRDNTRKVIEKEYKLLKVRISESDTLNKSLFVCII